MIVFCFSVDCMQECFSCKFCHFRHGVERQLFWPATYVAYVGSSFKKLTAIECDGITSISILVLIGLTVFTHFFFLVRCIGLQYAQPN